MDPATGEKQALEIDPYLNGQVFIPTALFEDAEGFIWIGTFNTGLLRYSQLTGKIERMSDVICNDITSITEDSQGNVWIGTMYGLSKYDRTVDRFTTYYASDGIGGNQFNERSVCRLPDHTLVFGGTHGLTLFNPIDITTRRQIPLFVEGLKVHNQFVKAAPGGIIETTMVHSPPIKLAYNEIIYSYIMQHWIIVNIPVCSTVINWRGSIRTGWRPETTDRHFIRICRPGIIPSG